MDIRDWIIVISMAGIQVAATVFIFKHPETLNFATWATVTGTLAGSYHWANLKDSKTPDV